PGSGRPRRLHRHRGRLHRRGRARRGGPGRVHPADRQHPPDLRNAPSRLVTSTGIRPPLTHHHPQTSALRARPSAPVTHHPQTGTRPRLHAPEPGWSVEADVVVVGSGVAGLTAALRCEAAGLTTVVVTKARLDDGSTRWAQGGIAAALGDGDTPEQHLDDTLVAGAGLCDEEAVRILVTEGPDAVRRLIATGAHFDES